MIQLTEDTSKDIIEKWRTEATKQTLETLPKFLSHLMDDYRHDYGTICHALSIGSIATMWAMDKHQQGGITGFQASAIMWENIANWATEYRGKPIKLVDYSKMLYPQYAHNFKQTIGRDTWKYLQKEAKENLAFSTGSSNVRGHWETIVNGAIPFGYTLSED